MIIAITGESGSGKSTIENELCTRYEFGKIISYTTRNPRDGENNGVDYYFTNNETFNDMINENLFAEYDTYSQGRLYGTLKSDYLNDDKVVVLTPNGLRQIKKNCPNVVIFSIFVKSNLGTRMKRYIDRCGVDKFDYDDKNEICSRVDRDFGMFLGMENEVDLVVENNDDTNIVALGAEIASEILKYVKKKEIRNNSTE